MFEHNIQINLVLQYPYFPVNIKFWIIIKKIQANDLIKKLRSKSNLGQNKRVKN